MVTDSNRQFKKLYKIVFLSKSRTPDKKLSLDKSSVERNGTILTAYCSKSFFFFARSESTYCSLIFIPVEMLSYVLISDLLARSSFRIKSE